ARLLGPIAVVLPGGSPSSIAALVASLQTSARAVMARAASSASSVRARLGEVDAATTGLADASRRATELGAGSIAELTVARDCLDAVTHALATDPLGDPPDVDLGAVVATAIRAVADLDTRHAT